MKLVQQKRKYQPYIADFIHLCERNYAQLRFLLPPESVPGDLQAQPGAQIQINASEGYRIRLLEVCKFTTTVRIEYIGSLSLDWLRPQFEVRLYHDARLAEVVACQQIRRFQAVYDYPNMQMAQPDEKRQINLLLRDWLALCLQQGYLCVGSLHS